MTLEEENKILRGFMKAFWEDLDGAAYERIHCLDLGSKIRASVIHIANDKNAYSLEEAIKLAPTIEV